MSSLHKILLTGFFGCFLLGNPTHADTVFDIFRRTEENKQNASEEETHASAILQTTSSSAQEKIDERKEQHLLSKVYCITSFRNAERNYCQEQLKEQWLEMLERKRILEKRKSWNLNSEYCFHRRTYENYQICETLLRNQQNECTQQITSGNRVIVDLEHQLLYGVKNCQLVLYSHVITGKNSTRTPTGTFQIYERRGEHFMQNTWFVTKAFYFWKGYALHDAGWRQDPYWSPETRAIYGSHGCVNIPDVPMQILWDTFDVGDSVEIYQILPEDIATELQEKVGSREPMGSSTGLEI